MKDLNCPHWGQRGHGGNAKIKKECQNFEHFWTKLVINVQWLMEKKPSQNAIFVM